MKFSVRKSGVLAAAVIGAFALAGCGTATEAGAPEASASAASSAIEVVASTNIYGQIVEQIGGEHVSVTSIIDSVTVDPHTYEATARDRLALEQAALVVSNGGGYDAYVDALVGDRDVERVIAVEQSHAFHEAHGDDDDHDDHDHDHADHDDHDADHDDHHGHSHIEGFNEHVWFDPHTMIHVVEAITEELGELSPANASFFTQNAAALIVELETAEARVENLSSQSATAVFLTEPLPGYLVTSAGLSDVTPEGFAEAVEAGNDVAPAVMLAASNLISAGGVTAVLANEQTSDAATAQILAEAEAAGVPIARFTELLAPGQTYLEWLNAGIDALEAAIAG